MYSDPVPSDLKALLHDRIETYEQLEILRLLHRNRVDTWTAERIAQQLNLTPTLVSSALDGLCANAFVKARSVLHDGAMAYALAPPPRGETLARLVEVYEEQPIEIIKLMSANAIERVRTAALRAFADAFVLHKGKDNG